MTKKILITTCMLVTLLLAGCGGISEDDLIGSWSGKIDMSASGAENEMMQQMMANMTMPLELKEDHTFTMTMMFIPAEGTWALDGDKLTLTYTKMMGMDMNAMSGDQTNNKPLVLTVSDDATSMQGIDPDSDQMNFVFTKK